MNRCGTKTLVRLVDDNTDLLDSLVYMLSCEGYQTVAYGSAVEFLEKDDPDIPGCIVLDVQMPELSGIELQQKLKAGCSKLPIIFLTAHGNVDMAVEALLDGAFDFQQKPIDPPKLFNSIAKALRTVCLTVPVENIHIEIDKVSRLSEREERILRAVARGLTNRTIAESLGLSKFTVDHYRQMGCDKIGLREPADLAAFFLRTDEWRQFHSKPYGQKRPEDHY